MKVSNIKGYETNFGYKQAPKPQSTNQEPGKGAVQNTPDSTQPLAGRIIPPKQFPVPPVLLPPVGGLITPPTSPKKPRPTAPQKPIPMTPGPLSGLVAPPDKPKTPQVPDIPVVTAGLISPPDGKKSTKPVEKN